MNTNVFRSRGLRTVLAALAIAAMPATGILLVAPAAVSASSPAGLATPRPGSPAGDYLLLDPRGRGRVVQVFGDLAAARRIAVLVPGMRTRLANYWRGVGGAEYRSPSVQAAALYRAMGSEGNAVIAWLGYDTPQTLREAAGDDRAIAGADALTAFVTGLVEAHPGATVTLLGHSYGSTVIGRAAARLPRAVTDIAVFGSPGLDVETVAALGTTARVWAGRSAGDWIRWVPGGRALGLGHVRNPADPAFGARIFPTADVADHDHYLAPGTDSLAALARIAAGRA